MDGDARTRFGHETFRIATETGNGFIAVQAYERMGMLAKARQSEEEAFEMYRKAQRVLNGIYQSVDDKQNRQSCIF